MIAKPWGEKGTIWIYEKYPRKTITAANLFLTKWPFIIVFRILPLCNPPPFFFFKKLSHEFQTPQYHTTRLGNMGVPGSVTSGLDLGPKNPKFYAN